MKNSRALNIYKYTDYRKFLGDKFQEKKNQERNFSYRKFSFLAGLSSPNFLKLVIDKKRNLSETGIRKFIKGFKLNENEGEYFRNMVFMNQSKSHEEKDCFYQKMVRCKGFSKTHRLEKQHYEYYSAWYHPVVRELIAFHEGKINPEWIAAHIEPKISTAQAKRSLKLLEALGMIKKEAERWVQADPIVTTGPEVTSVMVTKYHKNMISLAKDSIERFPPQKRDVSSVTIRVDSNKLPEIKKAAIDFRKHLLGLENNGDNGQNEEMVMQVNVQIFPLSEVPKGKRDETA